MIRPLNQDRTTLSVPTSAPETTKTSPQATAAASEDKSDQRVRRMFASIARRYDLLNHLLSLNIDRSWRTFTTRTVPPQAGVPVLDCCTGTADLALAYDRAAKGRSPVVGTDFCREMLLVGVRKVEKAAATGRVTLIEGDTQRLPVPSDTFGVVSVAFGLRNVRDTVAGVDEMIRAARPGGKVAILEFSRPRGRLLGPLYLTFFRKVLPRIGQAVAPNADDAYNYLPRTVLEFPDGQALLDLLGSRGLVDLEMHPLTFGVATLYVGTKPGPIAPGADAGGA
jgi:demethylmenaquinone methyltransferase/2-methoxy-6-polyprenyl-1,4-benzoquinol methylase